ncbi:MAG: hypothetical protein WCG84_04895 [Candidatus Moraniibacteriota bacterium]
MNVYTLLVFSRNAMIVMSILVGIVFWWTGAHGGDTQFIAYYSKFIFLNTFILWFICFCSQSLPKSDHKRPQMHEHQQLWVDYFRSKFPHRSESVIVEQLRLLNAAYRRWEFCRDLCSSDDPQVDRPFVQKADSIANVYRLFVNLFAPVYAVALQDPPQLMVFLQENADLAVGMSIVAYPTKMSDTRTIEEQYSVLEVCVKNMEESLANFIDEICHEQVTGFTDEDSPVKLMARFTSNEECIKHFATLFPHEEEDESRYNAVLAA